MKKILFAILCTLAVSSVALTTNPYADPNRVNIRGYYKSNGTYVQSYQRTAPNGITRII